MKDEYEIIMDVVVANTDILKPELFTFERFVEADVLVVTRCFGYSLPSLQIVPLADCANHHTTDSQYELLNSKIDSLRDRREELTEDQKEYFTFEKQRVNFRKHFKEDEYNDKIELPYRASRYAAKVKKRHEVLALTHE